MRHLRAWLIRLRGLFGKAARERDFADELESHLQMHVDDNIRAGMSPLEARRVAVMKLGGVEQTKEAYRDRSTIPFLESVGQDLLFTFRQLRKHPVFTITAIVMVALGIGANSAIFSSIHSLLINPLPFRDVDRVAVLWEKVPSQGRNRSESSLANYLDWRVRSKSFEHLSVYRSLNANLTGVQPPERIVGFQVSANFFEVVGVKPIIGRGFSADEDQPGKASVAILGYGLWQRRFGGAPNIIDKTIELNGVKRTVIGVLPSDFNYPPGVDVLTPLTMTNELTGNRATHVYLVIGRVRSGVTFPAAQAELDTIAKVLEQQYPQTNSGAGVVIYPILEDTVRFYKTAVLTFMAAVGFVLLIVCANVANLVLARACDRRKEMALRAALGAGRWRIVRLLLAESLTLALIGGALGALVGYWGIHLLRALNPGEAAKFVPGWDRMGFNLPVFAFNLMLSILSGLLFGLAPAWQVAKTDLNYLLKEGGRQTSAGAHRLRGLLVVTEVALSLMLLISAGLLMRTFLKLVNTDAGFNPANLMTMSISLPDARYAEEPKRAAFFRQLVERIQTIPGVQSAAAVSHLPLGGRNASNPFLIEGLPEPPPGQNPFGRHRTCTPDYFLTMGIPVLKGRAFSDQDDAKAPPVVIVNETLARTYWPNEDAIGKRIRIAGPPNEFPWMQIVGVVRDVRHELSSPVTSDFFRPIAQDVRSSMIVVAKTTGDPLSVGASMRQQVWNMDKDQPVYQLRSMEQVRDFSISLYSFSSASLALFAGIAVLLAAMGIYGVMSYAVSQRTQEIGIRIALGARQRDVLTMVVRNGMSLAVIGIVAGLAGAIAMTRLLANLLFGVSPTDVVTFSLVTLGLLLVALLACYIPARRATKVDPLIALRSE
jgi:putative ABC transport system permease protein